MIEVAVWVVVFILLAGCAYLVIRMSCRGLRAYYEHTTLRKMYHRYVLEPTMMDLLKCSGYENVHDRVYGIHTTTYQGREVLPEDWNRKVSDFEKEHWSTTAEREIRAREPGAINYYDKKGEVQNGGTREQKGSGTGADTE